MLEEVTDVKIFEENTSAIIETEQNQQQPQQLPEDINSASSERTKEGPTKPVNQRSHTELYAKVIDLLDTPNEIIVHEA